MASKLSDPSVVSLKSQMILDDVAKKSVTKIYKLGGVFDDEDIRTSWNAFGLYISRQLRMGRAVTIPSFGVFTFSAPEVTLNGVTNPSIRDKQLRAPVFIVGKDFVWGSELQSAIGTGTSIRPYAVSGSNGKIAQTKINFTEIGIYCSKSKDQAKAAVDRVIKQLSEETRKKGAVDMEIPNVGVFRVRGNLVAVTFNEFLMRDAKLNTDLHKSIQEKKQVGESKLTKETIQHFANLRQLREHLKDKGDEFLELDQNTREYLKNNLAIDVDQLHAQSLYAQRPTSAIQNKTPHVRGRYDDDNQSKMAHSQVRPMTAINRAQKNFDRINKMDYQTAFRQLTLWIRAQQLCPQDAFKEFCKIAFNNQPVEQQKIYPDQLYTGIQKIGLKISPIQVQELHRVLDYNKDGNIDLNDWITVIKEESNTYVQKLKDVISARKIKMDDLLQTMKLSRDQKQIDLATLQESIKRIDPSLNDQKAVQAAKFLMKGMELVDIGFVVDQLGCQPEEFLEEAEQYIGQDWYNSILLRLKKKLAQLPNQDILFEMFEKADINNNGDINISDFKTCLLNLNLGFTVNELNRLARYVDKTPQGEINYSDFIKQMNDVERHQHQPNTDSYFQDLHDFIQKLQGFMKKNRVEQAKDFYVKLRETTSHSDIKVSDFSTFLFQRAFPQSTEEEIQKYAAEIDIDRDQVISLEDLETFFDRLEYIDEAENASSVHQDEEGSLKATSQLNLPTSFIKEAKLYPQKPLDNKQIQLILRDIKQTLYLKKMSFFDFFKLLDSNQDGFITVNEWHTNLEKLKKLNAKIKNGLFAYMDKQKIGMIDYQSFLQALEANQTEVVDKDIELKGIKKEDDWVWCNQQIQRMKEWFKVEEITVDDAFRVIDQDFDGYIGKQDIEKFLLEVLHVSAKEISPLRLNRLFKLMDQYKRGQIQLLDIKRIFSESKNSNLNFTVTGGRFIQGRDTYDWKTNAKQQLGLVLSRKFDSLDQSFDHIAENGKHILYKQFENWVKQSHALIGFDLTDQQIQVVFSDTDPHKKGYLTLQDWTTAFSGYGWLTSMLRELQDTLKLYFSTQEEAFLFFTNGQDIAHINYEMFARAIKTLFSDRFTTQDINKLWRKLCDRQDGQFHRENFVLVYDKLDSFDATNARKRRVLDRPTTAPMIRANKIELKPSIAPKNQLQSQLQAPGKIQQTIGEGGWVVAKHKTPQQELLEQQCQKIVKKVKMVLRSSDKSLEEIFREMDADKSGELSNLEFKNAFRQLNIGLTSKEIDQLLDYCDQTGDGVINYQEFVENFRLADSHQRILMRSKHRLQKINDYIHYYMLSPKDAFRLFNEDRTGLMKYDDFHRFMDKLYKMANEPLPSFVLLKDLFQTIDIRKDGIIDLNEWTQTFKQFQPPNASMQGRPLINLPSQEMQQSGQIRRTQSAKNNPKHFFTQSPVSTIQANQPAYLIESSKKYDKIMNIIGRNRKYLLSIFQDINKREPVTYYITKEVLKQLLRNVGLVLDDECYPHLIKFAERDGVVDFKFMLEVYKERMGRIQLQPLTATQFPPQVL